MSYLEDENLINTYFEYLGQWGNTKLASQHCAISTASGRRLEEKYPEKAEEANFEYRETLREELIKRIKDPEQFSERLLLKELEMVDHRYRPKMEVQHNHSVELVGRLQKAKERMMEMGGELKPVPPIYVAHTAAIEAMADERAPMMADSEKEVKGIRTDIGKIIEAEFSEL